jgi:hypothetical protein
MKRLMHILFLSCLKATELIEKKFYFKLKLREKLQLSMHKSMCKACQFYEDQSVLIDEALYKHKLKNPELNVDRLKADIKEKVFNE